MNHYTYVLIDPRDESVFYIGKGFRNRMTKHFVEVSANRHRNSKLKNKIFKILSVGLKPLAEKIFEHCDEWPCHVNEMAAISFYGLENLCNLTVGGEGSFGWVHSDESKAKQSAAKIGAKHPYFGKKRPAEVGAKISAIRLGKKLSAETKAKLAEVAGDKHWNFGKHISEETKSKMRVRAVARMEKNNPFRGKPLSLEHRAKLSECKKGKANPSFGKPLSEETKAKLRAVNLGKIFSLETKAKISAALRGQKNPNFGKHVGRPRKMCQQHKTSL